MIRAFNTKQVALALWNFLLSAVSFGLCYLFFRFTFIWLLAQYDGFHLLLGAGHAGIQGGGEGDQGQIGRELNRVLVEQIVPPSPEPWASLVPLLPVTFIGLIGWFRAKADQGLVSYHESGLMLGAPTTGAGHHARRGINRVAGIAYILSQIFLSGPLQLLRGINRLRDLIPLSEELEEKLAATLSEIQTRNKWESPEDYPEQVREVFLLNRMELIDFSPTKMKFRAKS